MIVFRLANNILDVDGHKVFHENGEWKAVNRKPLTRKQNQYILAFLEEEAIAQHHCFNIKTDKILFELLYKQQTKYNEWHFIKNVVKAIETECEVSYDIIERTTPDPNQLFEGILKDKKGNIYYLSENDSNDMFNMMLFNHNLTIQEEYIKRQIIIASNHNGQLMFEFNEIDI